MVDQEMVKLGDTEYPLGKITARRGLTAAALLAPHISALRPVFESAVAGPKGKQPNAARGIGLAMQTIDALAPLLDADTFLKIAAAATGIGEDILAEAPLEDVITATLTAIKKLNIMQLLTSAMGAIGTPASA